MCGDQFLQPAGGMVAGLLSKPGRRLVVARLGGKRPQQSLPLAMQLEQKGDGRRSMAWSDCPAQRLVSNRSSVSRACWSRNLSYRQPSRASLSGNRAYESPTEERLRRTISPIEISSKRRFSNSASAASRMRRSGSLGSRLPGAGWAHSHQPGDAWRPPAWITAPRTRNRI